MLTQPRRLISAAVAVLLGVAFVAASLVLGSTFTATLERTAAGSVRDAAVVVTTKAAAEPARIPSSYVESLAGLPGVSEARPLVDTVFLQDLGSRQALVRGQTTPRQGEGTLTAGRLPERPGEVAINEALASARTLGVGDSLTLSRPGGSAPAAVQAWVVGVWAPGPQARRGADLPSAYAANAVLQSWAGQEGFDEVLVSAPGADQEALAQAAQRLPGAGGVQVRTGAAETAHRVSEATSGTEILTGILLAFAAVSVLVSSLVISNTFSILVAQRVRELALLRCVGATRRQVFRSVLAEAAALALVASGVGIALGVALVWVVSRLSQGTPMALAAPAVGAVELVVPLLVGLTVTLLSAILPARRATRVAPLAALRPDHAPLTRTRAGRARLVVGAALAVGGTAALAVAAGRHELPLGLAGGAASLIGVVMLGSLIVPPLARVLGALPARLGGEPGRLAVDNSRRNPARAAATASALFVGVTLITLMSVGAATGQASIDRALDRKMPVDLSVDAPAGTMPPEVLTSVRSSPDVAAAMSVHTGQVTLDGAGSGRVVEAVGVEAQAAQVVRAEAYVAGLSDDTMLVDTSLGIADGASVTVRGPGTAAGATTGPGGSAASGAGRTVRVIAREGGPSVPIVTADTLRAANPQARQSVWARYRDGVDTRAAQERVADRLAAHRGLEIGGAAALRAEMEKIVQIMLMVVTGLLAVAVLIALVGVGNTLGLSVLERRRETGLLRALGLTRQQVRAMLGLEALTLAGVGTALGVALGIGYGLAGAHALMGGEVTVLNTVPWGRLALVVAVALGAGWLASVIPASRAAKVPPSAALASE